MAPSQPSEPNEGLNWQARVAIKQAETRDAIPKEWRLPQSVLRALPDLSELHKTKVDLIALDIPRRSGILTERELDITENHDVSSLLKSLASGHFTSSEVTKAFSKRAAIAQQLTNCLTETFFDKARERARYLDDARSRGKPLGPLHGLPISLKDSYQMEGTDATIGAVAFIGRKSTENSPLVKMLLELGAVLYVKTNVSQVLMTIDSANNVFGRVLNPYNTTLTAGGSTSGEGALIALHGSPLGVGTDVAGSIRVPALCCGIYGFKPSTARIPYAGQVMPITPGLSTIVPAAGPLSNDLAALATFTKAIIDARPARLDSTVHDVPWRDVTTTDDSLGQQSTFERGGENHIKNRKLRLGLLPEDPLFPIHPPAKQALATALEKLTSRGHEIVPLPQTSNSPQHGIAAATQIALALLALDARPSAIIASGAGEPAVPSMGNWARQAAAMEEEGWRFVEGGLREEDDRLARLAKLQVMRGRVADWWRREVWEGEEEAIDAVVSVAAQGVAWGHDRSGIPAYSIFLNALDYPACIVPFGRAGEGEVGFEMATGKGGPACDPDAVAGAPLSIQIFTSRLRDEECLAVAEVVDACLNQSDPAAQAGPSKSISAAHSISTVRHA